jgi:hypothetical protein
VLRGAESCHDYTGGPAPAQRPALHAGPHLRHEPQIHHHTPCNSRHLLRRLFQDRRDPSVLGAHRRRRREQEQTLVHLRRPRRRRLDREHEQRPRRQQEALSEQRRDHQAAGHDDDDVRSRRSGSGVARDRFPMRDGLPRTGSFGVGAVRQLLDQEIAAGQFPKPKLEK